MSQSASIKNYIGNVALDMWNNLNQVLKKKYICKARYSFFNRCSGICRVNITS